MTSKPAIESKGMRRLLKRLQMTQLWTLREIADHIGVSYPTLWSWQKDPGKIQLRYFAKLCDYADISVGNAYEEITNK